jgi:release factor glutamine methyltransferase
LFVAFEGVRFVAIAANPPYIPEHRALDASVAEHEPREALYAGSEGLGIIRRIAADAPAHLSPGGELWMECDAENADAARGLLAAHGAGQALMRTDLYGRPRLAIGYY